MSIYRIETPYSHDPSICDSQFQYCCRLTQQVSVQSTYSTTAINFDFALITLIADVAPTLGYFGIERGTGDVKYDINSAGYPADKSSGSMWLTTCSNVEYDFGGNQGVFKDVSQCTNNVSTLFVIHQDHLQSCQLSRSWHRQCMEHQMTCANP